MKNLIIGLLTLVIIGGGGWIVYNEFVGEKDAAMEEGDMMETSPQLSWLMTEAGEDETTGAPMTNVTLIANGTEHELGTFMGSCMVVDGTSWELQEGEISGVICYFAGGGDELGVFEEDEAFVVKRGIVEEGSAEIAGFRGNFETILSL